MYGSIGRGFSQKSSHSTDPYCAARDKAPDLVGADPDIYTCFYDNNTTDGRPFFILYHLYTFRSMLSMHTV